VIAVCQAAVVIVFESAQKNFESAQKHGNSQVESVLLAVQTVEVAMETDQVKNTKLFRSDFEAIRPNPSQK
jgi:hypothetical protein